MTDRFHYDVGGVPGLHLALDFFPESVEERLFCDKTMFPRLDQSERAGNEGNRRHALSMHHPFLPDTLQGVCNGVVDSGFFPDFIVQPDYKLPWTYTDKGRFEKHFDSRYSWGETVCGVNLGVGGVMEFYPATAPAKALEETCREACKKTEGEGLSRLKTVFVKTLKTFRVEVLLPSRSVYIMSGASRTDWKHGIQQNTTDRRALFPTPVPSWNPHNFRRAITLRMAKFFSDEVLRRLVERNPQDEALQARWEAQCKFKPKLRSDCNLRKEEVEEQRKLFRKKVDALLAPGVGNLEYRLPEGERNYVEKNRDTGAWPLSNVGGAHWDPLEWEASMMAAAAARALQGAGPLAGAGAEQAAAAPAFQGGGNAPGGGASGGGGGEDDDLQQAIALSLGEGPAARSHGSGNAPGGGASGGGGGEDDDLQQAIALSLGEGPAARSAVFQGSGNVLGGGAIGGGGDEDEDEKRFHLQVEQAKALSMQSLTMPTASSKPGQSKPATVDVIDLCDSLDDERDDAQRKRSKPAVKRAKSTASPPSADELRAARLARFG